MEEGKIVWRTCFRKAVIPACHIAALADEVYFLDAVNEPSSLRNAIDSWLLLEILTVIGNHGIL